MCVGCWAGVTYLRYTVLTSPNKDETAVHCCDPALSVLVVLVSRNVFHVVSALQSIVSKKDFAKRFFCINTVEYCFRRYCSKLLGVKGCNYKYVIAFQTHKLYYGCTNLLLLKSAVGKKDGDWYIYL